VVLTYSYIPKIDFHPMSAGEFGCFCSHMEIMRNIARYMINYNKSYSFLILEDDAVIPLDFKQKLDTIRSNLFSPNSWDIVTLYQEIPSWAKVKNILFNTHVQHISAKAGFHAYIVHIDAALRMMNLSTNVFTRIDLQSFMHSNLRAFRSTDVDIRQRNTNQYLSDIKDRMGKCGAYKNCVE